MDLLGLPVRWPIVGAPMAGGPSTPALAAAVSRAGGTRDFSPAGTSAPRPWHSDIAEVRHVGGVVLRREPLRPREAAEVDEAALDTYLDSLRPEAEAFGVDVVADMGRRPLPREARAPRTRSGAGRELHVRVSLVRRRRALCTGRSHAS